MERYSLHKRIDMVLAHYSLTREKVASQIDIQPPVSLDLARSARATTRQT